MVLITKEAGYEYRCTQTCETAIDIVAKALNAKNRCAHRENIRILLANIEGNQHNTGLCFVSLSLQELGVFTKVIAETSVPEILRAALGGKFPFVGISVSLTEQIPALQKTIQIFLDSEFDGVLLIGGRAINSGLKRSVGSTKIRFVSRPMFSLNEWQDLLSED